MENFVLYIGYFLYTHAFAFKHFFAILNAVNVKIIRQYY